MKKRGIVNLPVIIISILIIIVLISLFLVLLQYFKNAYDDPKDLENITQMEQIEDSINHNLSITDNPPPCQDECSARGLRSCSEGGYKICGNFDSDTCYEWSSITNCEGEEECSSGDTFSAAIYDFDEIELISTERFNITKVKNLDSITWADSLLEGEKALEVTYSIFNLKKNTSSIAVKEQYLKVKGKNQEKSFLINSISSEYDLQRNKIQERLFFWSAKQLIGESVIKNKTEPVYSASLSRKFEFGNISATKLSFSNQGLDVDKENEVFNWIKIIPQDENNEVSQSQEINCSENEDIDLYVMPILNMPNEDIYIKLKCSSLTSLESISVNIYDTNQNIIKVVRLYNDGAHQDGAANDESLSNYFNISTEGEYSAKICSKKVDFEVKNFSLEPLYQNHNNLNADRINIILVGSGYDSIEDFLELSKKILAFDGNFTTYNITTRTTDLETLETWDYTGEYKQIGFFATEPLKSNKNKLNVWYLSEQLNGSMGELIQKIRPIDQDINKYSSPSKLNYNAYILIRNGEFDEKDQINDEEKSRSNARQPNFFGKKLIDKEEINFGISFDSFPIIKNGTIKIIEEEDKETGLAKRFKEESFLEGINTIQDYSMLTHEAGHSIFGLLDEYYEQPGEEVRYGYPQCAHNITEAQEWWGDLIGEIDSFYYEVQKFTNQKNEEEIQIGYINGGCFGLNYGEEGVVRPSVNSMMRNDKAYPIFGSVNKRRVQQVLDLFNNI